MTIEIALIIIIVLLVLILIVTFVHAKASVFWTREILKYAKERYEKPNADLQKLLDKREYSKIVSEVTEKRLANTTDSALYWYKGLALFHLDNWDEARTVLRHAIEMNPSYENGLSPYLRRIENQDAPNKSPEQPGHE